MSPIFYILIWIFFTLQCLTPRAFLPMPIHDPVKAIQGLIQRRIPSYADYFTFEVIAPTRDGLDIFEVEQMGSKIELRGSSATALASALNWYMKTYALGQMSWNADNLNLPFPPPKVTTKLKKKRESRYTYHQNVCTVSYSSWNWDWQRWEKHIDWMALNGINMPLAFTGQEKVWQNVFRKYFGISQEGIDDFFSGPAFLAWQRMGNLQGSWVKGPLPQSFIEGQYQLQLLILTRIKEFGMLAALPAFAGHVPKEFEDKYPNARISIAPKWGGFVGKFTGVRTVEPMDPLFFEIGRRFIEEQSFLYNYTSSLYQADTYNEMDPLSGDLEYLKMSSQAVVSAIRAADPSGVWLMQGWLFQSTGYWNNQRIEAYLSSISKNELIILDLYSEVHPVWSRTNNFFGKYWIYCVLHNFGGDLGLRGDLPSISSDIVFARQVSGDTLIGVGLTMEGIFQNYVVYELTLEMGWHSQNMNTQDWLVGYADRRYGGKNEYVRNAWKTLGQGVYNCTRCYGGVPKNVVVWRPSFGLVRDGFMGSDLGYNSKDIIQAWNLILQGAEQFLNVDTYLYDIVDITRQAISNAIYDEYKKLVAAYKQKGDACSIGTKILEMIQDLERILSCHSEFMLGKWLSDSRKLGETEDEKMFYEYEGRNLVTRWGDNNNNTVADYASKQWAGLMSSYYLIRWKMFVSHLCTQSVNGLPVDFPTLYAQMEMFEVQWQLQTYRFPEEPEENAITVSKELYSKYGKLASLSELCKDSKALSISGSSVECLGGAVNQ